MATELLAFIAWGIGFLMGVGVMLEFHLACRAQERMRD